MQAFHAKHFPGECEARHGLDTEQYLEEEDYDDGLGYYEDGVKRTLTDEQIAMFRHSEIQQLLRQREQRLEEEADKDTRSTESMTVGTETPNLQELEQTTEAVSTTTVAQPDDASKSKKRKKRKPPNKRPGWSDKRKKDDEQDWTHRRRAREQDEVEAENIELDY